MIPIVNFSLRQLHRYRLLTYLLVICLIVLLYTTRAFLKPSKIKKIKYLILQLVKNALANQVI